MKQTRTARILDDLQSIQKEIGRRLQEVRFELGLSQVELAKECGVSNMRLSENENGRGLISTDLVIALWQAYQVSPFYLLLGIGPRRFGATAVSGEGGLAVLERVRAALQEGEEWLLMNAGEALPQPEPEDMYRFSNVRSIKRVEPEGYSAEEVAELLNEIRQRKSIEKS